MSFRWNADVPVTPEGKMFGERVRRLREERGISQEKLANSERLGSSTISTGHLSDIERGLKVPSLTVILKLAYALDCPPADLLVDFTPAAIRRLIAR